MPNLMQTLEGTPAFVHAGPFANIAHGNSSIVADQIALKLADYVVTEAGFGADIGMEKFFDIKCRDSRPHPERGGAGGHRPRAQDARRRAQGRRRASPLRQGATPREPAALEKGVGNLVKHIENRQLFGIPVVVAINRFTSDTEPRSKLVTKVADRRGGVRRRSVRGTGPRAARAARAGRGRRRGLRAAEQLPVPLSARRPIKEKIETIATRDLRRERGGLPAAGRAADQRMYEKAGFGKLPICMAKTHLSLSHDPS